MGSVRGAESGVRTASQKTAANPLDVMLLRANRTSLYVDFWSLDVEGFEMTVLGGIDFEKIRVDSILVEDFWLSNRALDRLLTGNGFLKLRQMQIDSVWVNRRAVADLRRENAQLKDANRVVYQTSLFSDPNDRPLPITGHGYCAPFPGVISPPKAPAGPPPPP